VLTARPSADDETRTPHRLYGHVKASAPYSVGRYQEEAAAMLAEARSAKRVAIFTGGTGLYFDALTKGLSPIPGVSAEIRDGARSVAFAVPNAVGVQEGVYILVGASFGLTPETALALSLLKRARDLIIGLPALAAWQLLEGGRLWRRIGAPEGIRMAGKRNPGRDDRGSSLVSWLR